MTGSDSAPARSPSAPVGVLLANLCLHAPFLLPEVRSFLALQEKRLASSLVWLVPSEETQDSLRGARFVLLLRPHGMLGGAAEHAAQKDRDTSSDLHYG